MSAIMGIVSSTTEDMRVIGSMAEQLSHRGPAGGGRLWIDPDGKVQTEYDTAPPPKSLPARAAIAYRRSDGKRQPLHESHYYIVMDGSIFNAPDLRPELKLSASASDAELALAAFRKWGTQGFAKLNGHWALAILDTEARSVTLARDHLGVRPLHCWLYRDQFAFASEIKALFSMPEIRPKLDRQTMTEFLLGLPWGGKRFFAGIQELPPGNFVTVPLEKPAYKPEPFWQPTAGDETNAAEKLRALLATAIDRQADGAAISLSGGPASTALAAALRQRVGTQGAVYSFTALFDENRAWLEDANQVAHSITNEIMPTGSDFVLEFDTMLWYHDEPFADAGTYAQWCVMRAVHEARLPTILEGLGIGALLPPSPPSRKWWKPSNPEAHALKRLMRNLQPPVTPASGNLTDTIRATDRNAAAFGVQARLPYLDFELAGFLIGLPDKLKNDAFLQQVFQPLVPAPILARQSEPGYSIPLAHWMQSAILPALMGDIKQTRLPLVPLIDGGALRELVTKQMNRLDPALAPLLFRIFVANRWLHRFKMSSAV